MPVDTKDLIAVFYKSARGLTTRTVCRLASAHTHGVSFTGSKRAAVAEVWAKAVLGVGPHQGMQVGALRDALERMKRSLKRATTAERKRQRLKSAQAAESIHVVEMVRDLIGETNAKRRAALRESILQHDDDTFHRAIAYASRQLLEAREQAVIHLKIADDHSSARNALQQCIHGAGIIRSSG